MTLKRTADQAGLTDADITYHSSEEESEESDHSSEEESEESDVSSDEEEMPCDDDFDGCDPCKGQQCCGNLAGQRCPFGWIRAANDLGLQVEDDWTCATCATWLIKVPGGYCSKYRCPNYNQEGQCDKCRPSYAFH